MATRVDPTLVHRVLAVRCRATASLQMQMAAALIGKGQEELRKHFLQSAETLVSAADALWGKAHG